MKMNDNNVKPIHNHQCSTKSVRKSYIFIAHTVSICELKFVVGTSSKYWLKNNF